MKIALRHIRRCSGVKPLVKSLEEHQKGRCAICHKVVQVDVKKKEMLVLDHNHKTGAIRSLLCQSCNRGLGCFNDNLMILLNAVQYLMYWKRNPRPIIDTGWTAEKRAAALAKGRETRITKGMPPAGRYPKIYRPKDAEIKAMRERLNGEKQ